MQLGGPSRIAYSSIVLGARLALVDVDRAEAVFAEALEAALVARNDWVDLFAATQIALLQARRGDWASASNMLVEAAERANRQGQHFATAGALGHLAILLAAMQADEAALLLGIWSEHTGGRLDTSHPLFEGLSDRYEALISDLPARRREDAAAQGGGYGRASKCWP